MIKIITKNIVPHHDKIMQYNEQHSPTLYLNYY